MPWHYSNDPSKSAKDAVRFEIGDTDPQDPLLQDEEINYILNQYNQGVLMAAIRCAQNIMTKFGRLADENVGQVNIKFSQKANSYRKIITDLRARLAIEDMTPYAGGISKTDKETVRENADRVKPDFSKHQMENQRISPRTSSEGDLLDRLIPDDDS